MAQGSSLGPLFYLIFSNDLARLFPGAHVTLYADDLVISLCGDDTSQLEQQMNTHLANLLDWANFSRLPINLTKSQYMIFSNRIPPSLDIKIGTTSLSKVDTIKYLGIHLDSHLKFREHLTQLNKRLAQLRGITWRISSSLDFQAAKLFYYSFVQSILSYGIEVWGGRLLVYQCTETLNLIRRILLNLFSRHTSVNSVEEICNCLGVLNIHDLYRWKVSQMFYNIRHGNVLPMFNFEDVSIAYNLRLQPQVLVTFPRTDSLKMSFRYCAKLLWNAIAEEVRNKSGSREFTVAYKNLLLLTYAS